VADRFGVSVATIRRWVREKRIPFIRPSRRILRFRLSDVEHAVSSDPEGRPCHH
jgi:excisionase family DNA binding protein